MDPSQSTARPSTEAVVTRNRGRWAFPVRKFHSVPHHEQLQKGATKSNDVLRKLRPDIQWVESYIAADKMFCVYLGKDEEIIHRHAELSGFPATKVTEVGKIIDGTTGE